MEWIKRVWWALMGAYNHRRLATEIATVEADLQRQVLRKRPDDGSDVDVLRQALTILDQAAEALRAREPERGWRLLLAAQREAAHGLGSAAMTDRANVLRIEAQAKLKNWRWEAVDALLPEGEKVVPSRLDQAMGLLHEHFGNEYLRIAMVREQVLILSGMAFLILAALVGGIAGGWVALGIPVLGEYERALGIALLGGLGGSLVAIYSTIRSGGRGRLPDLIGNRPFAVMRPVIGAGSALAVVVVLGAASLNLTASAAAAVAVAAGFSELVLERSVEAVAPR